MPDTLEMKCVSITPHLFIATEHLPGADYSHVDSGKVDGNSAPAENIRILQQQKLRWENEWM